MAISAKDAIKKFKVQLLQRLPLDDSLFFAKAYAAGLFPMGTDNNVKAEKTRARKVDYFLHHVVEPEADNYFPKLLEIMRESDNLVLSTLACVIDAALQPGEKQEDKEQKHNEEEESSSVKLDTDGSSCGEWVHKQAYDNYADYLVKCLPMDDPFFIAKLSEYNLLSRDVKNKIQSLVTQAYKASHFLSHVIKPALEFSATATFGNLLAAMADCDYDHVKNLSCKIKSKIDEAVETSNTDNMKLDSSGLTYFDMAYKQAYDVYAENLVRFLPMDDYLFIAMLQKNNLLPGDVKDEILSQTLKADKALYFLMHIIKPALEINDASSFEKLLTIMEDCGGEVTMLSCKIKSGIDKPVETNRTRKLESDITAPEDLL